MNVPSNEKVYGVDFSNHQGEMIGADARALIEQGQRLAVIRLNTDLAGGAALTFQQSNAMRANGVPTLGYGWAHWRDNPNDRATADAKLAIQCGMPAVFLDMEDAVPTGVDAVAWANAYRATIRSLGLLFGWYTYLYWPGNQRVAIDRFGDSPWWLASKPLELSADNLAHSLGGITVMGQQYNDGSFDGKADDLDWFIFSEEWANRINGVTEDDMDEATIRSIVRDEIGKALNAAGQGTDLGVFAGAVAKRLKGASRAFDTSLDAPDV